MTIQETSLIKSKIYTLRGVKIMLDEDLAFLYRVELKRLNEQFKRNKERFPIDFAFQLTAEEYDSLRSHFATLKNKRGQHRKYLPYAFTEYGTLMLASILKSELAIQVNQSIIRIFVELRQQILHQPDYGLFQQTMKQIESRMDAIEANHLVDNVVLSTKMGQISQDIYRFSNALEEFQNTTIIIKKPDDTSFLG